KNNYNFEAWSIFFNKFSKLLENNKPNIAILLGDRIETLFAAIALHSFNIPIAHIGGGELTKGATDNAFRHSITKLSNLHFVSNNTYYKRVLQLGENKNNVFIVGDPAVELIKKSKFKSKIQIENSLGFKLFKKNIIVTFHPETLDLNNNNKKFKILLDFLENLKEYRIIFTFPNSDQNSVEIIKLLKISTKKNRNFIIFKEMGTLNYLSTMKYCEFILGNSSSGLTEAPILNIPSINYGSRQEGRIRFQTVIDCDTNIKSLKNSYKKIQNIKKNKIKIKGQDFSDRLSNILTKKINKINIKKEFIDLK
ncbi:MAG: UDP-N-acetylglucosamine 2-epimerase (hydrolyzing), partial [Pelagibacteraceae bacterium]|nr:UDP-N-acetylglucosamine 2-epimerase (hydrolyzing) [Pelagibacteraceae bacterium]